MCNNERNLMLSHSHKLFNRLANLIEKHGLATSQEQYVVSWWLSLFIISFEHTPNLIFNDLFKWF